MNKFASKKCQPCEGKTQALTETVVKELCQKISGWDYCDGQIHRSFSFRNFYETMAFANTVAWIANSEDHHPDMELSYKTCIVKYSTHAINGISENDFICAAKINRLLGEE